MKDIILVLGMHRSGTSLMTKAVNVLGAGLGDRLMAGAEDNPKGFFEDLDVNAFNEALLGRLNLRWNMPMLIRPEDLKGDDFRRLRAEAAGLLKKKAAQYGIFALKDPRISLLLPFWMGVIDGLGWRCRCLIALRNPLDVADSLARRNGMETRAALQLWLAYNLQVLATLAGKPFPKVVVEYNRILDDPAGELQRIGAALGMPEAEAGEVAAFASSFVDADLSHARASRAELEGYRDSVPEVVELYGLLSDLSVGAWSDERVAEVLAGCPAERIERANFRVALNAARWERERLEAGKMQALADQSKGYEAELARIVGEHRQALEQQAKGYEAEMERIGGERRQALEQQAKGYEAEMARIGMGHRDALERQAQGYEAQLTRLQNELATILGERDNARQGGATLRNDLEFVQADNARMHIDRQDIEAAVAMLAQQVAGLSEGAKYSAALLENATRTITEIEGSVTYKAANALAFPLRLLRR